MPWPAPTPLPNDDERAPNYTPNESDATHHVEDDTGLEDENDQHTDKGKMYLELLAQSSKKRNKKSLSTYSGQAHHRTPTFIDTSIIGEWIRVVKRLKTIKDDLVVYIDSQKSKMEKILKQSPNQFERSKKIKRSKHE